MALKTHTQKTHLLPWHKHFVPSNKLLCEEAQEAYDSTPDFGPMGSIELFGRSYSAAIGEVL